MDLASLPRRLITPARRAFLERCRFSCRRILLGGFFDGFTRVMSDEQLAVDPSNTLHECHRDDRYHQANEYRQLEGDHEVLQSVVLELVSRRRIAVASSDALRHGEFVEDFLDDGLGVFLLGFGLECDRHAVA